MKPTWNDTARQLRPGTVGGPTTFSTPLDRTPTKRAPLTQDREHPLEGLKRQLLRDTLAVVEDPTLVAPIRRAANEAAALAWLEPLPLFVFPELFVEKARATLDQAQRQRHVRARTARLTEALA